MSDDQGPVAAPPQLIEHVQLGAVAGGCLFLLFLVDAAGLFILFGGAKTYVESSALGQLANLVDRTNGLLILMLINQALGLGVLAGLQRTYEIKR